MFLSHFSHFSKKKKRGAKLASHSSPASASPSTPAAQLEDAPLPDSVEWVRVLALQKHHQNSTRRPQRETKRAKMVPGEGKKKKREILGPPPFGPSWPYPLGPHLRGPTPSGPHPSRPPFGAPTLRGPLTLWPPLFGAPTLRAPHLSGPPPFGARGGPTRLALTPQAPPTRIGVGRATRAGGGVRDAAHGHVPEAPLPQGRVLRHVVGHLSVPALDVPVPQMVDQLPDIEQFFRALSPDPEQVIEVPKILLDDVRERTAVRVTQLAEQLVEVPTPASCMEQIVDIPASVRGVSGSLQGFPPEQSAAKRTTSQIADIPVPGPAVLVFPQNRVQQLHMFLRNAFLSELSRSVLVETFLLVVQVLVSFSRDRLQQLLVPSSSPTSLLLEVLTVFSQDSFQRRLLDLFTPMCTCPTRPNGCSFVMTPRQSLISGTDALATMWKPPPGIRVVWVGEKSSGGRFGTGTRVPVLVHMTSLLCLLSEAHRGEGLGIPSPLPLACSVSARCLRRTGLVSSVSFVLLARQWIQYIRL